MKVVFVCSGNTCRSPLAVAAWRALAAQHDCSCSADCTLGRVEVASAGLSAVEGAPAAPHALRIAEEWGQNLSLHRARMFSPADAKADLIVTMTGAQAVVIRSHFRVPSQRLHLLGAFAQISPCPDRARLAPLLAQVSADLDASNDILDPFGASFEAYSDCALRIRESVEGLAALFTRFNPSQSAP